MILPHLTSANKSAGQPKVRGHFAPFGRIVWLFDGGSEPSYSAVRWLRRMCLSPAAVENLPHIVVRDAKRRRLWLVDVPALGRQVTSDTRIALKEILNNASEWLLFANAFENRKQLTPLIGDSLWGTVAWFADEPDHLVIFDDAVVPRLLRPASYGPQTPVIPRATRRSGKKL